MTAAIEPAPGPSETAERLAAALVERAGARITVGLADVFEALDTVQPGLATAPDKRERVGDLLAELASAGFLEPSRTRFDRSEAPALPAFVRLLVPRVTGRIAAAASAYAWRPELAWAGSEPLTEREFQHLKALQSFLRNSGATRPLVPAQERSLELFGHEKTLDLELRPSRLWTDGRLSFDLLRCRPAATPLPHRVTGPGSWLLVAENAATFDSLAATMPEDSPVGIVAWGGGGMFRSTVEWVRELPAITARREVAAIRYFGDLDLEGLRIPMAASATAMRAGLPPVRPAVGLYARLLAVGRPEPATPLAPEVAAELAAWLGPSLAPAAEALLVSGYRLAQEAVGLDRLAEDQLWATASGLGPEPMGTPLGMAKVIPTRVPRDAARGPSGEGTIAFRCQPRLPEHG
jgi:Uncharacterized protein conserved in bacteria C-term(DUF2220).